jgi:uncharacterized protein (TIGR03435 family)
MRVKRQASQQQVIGCILLGFLPAFSWAQDSLTQAFEVASVKQSPPGRTGAGSAPPGKSPLRFSQHNAPLVVLIQIAHGLRDFQISGGADWVRSKNFDVDASAAEPASEAQKEAMLRQLIGERFGLKYHFETREMAAYALVQGRRGAKFGPNFHRITPEEPPPSMFPGVFTMRNGLPQLAKLVSVYLKIKFPSSGDAVSVPEPLPAIDQTGLEGEYHIQVDLRQNGDWFAVLEDQLGLRLERRKIAVNVLIIDSAVEPTVN